MLQKLLYDKLNFIAPFKLGVKQKAGLECCTFDSYVREALPTMGIAMGDVQDEDVARVAAQCEPYRTQLYLLWILRAVLGECIETMILVDRQCFLEEYGLCTSADICFDGNLSPRNIALIAWQREAAQ